MELLYAVTDQKVATKGLVKISHCLGELVPLALMSYCKQFVTNQLSVTNQLHVCMSVTLDISTAYNKSMCGNWKACLWPKHMPNTCTSTCASGGSHGDLVVVLISCAKKKIL